MCRDQDGEGVLKGLLLVAGCDNLGTRQGAWVRILNCNFAPKAAPLSPSPNTRIRYEIEGGEGELEVGLDHPLGAPFRKTARTGGPPGDWNFVLVQVEKQQRIAGTLLHTPSPGNRLIFFPAFRSWPEEELHPTDVGLVDQPIDHLTLDPPKRQKPGYYSSHITFENGERGFGRTIEVPEDRLVPWFGLRLPDPQNLPAAPRDLWIEFTSIRVEADAAIDEYASEIVGRGGLTHLHLRPSPYDPSFVSLDLWAGWGKEAKGKKAGPLPIDFSSSYIRDIPPRSQDVMVHAQGAGFPRDARVILFLSHYGGRLTETRMYQPRQFSDD